MTTLAKPKTSSVFRIRQADCKTRWWVSSQSRPDVEHLVDLMFYHQIGKCTCERFSFGLEPIARLATRPTDNLRCKHIRAAREALMDALLWQISEHEIPDSFEYDEFNN